MRLRNVEENPDGGYYATNHGDQMHLSCDQCSDNRCNQCGASPGDHVVVDGEGDEHYAIWTYSDDWYTLCNWCLLSATKEIHRFWCYDSQDDTEKNFRQIVADEPDSAVGHLALADYLEEKYGGVPEVQPYITFHRYLGSKLSNIS